MRTLRQPLLSLSVLSLFACSSAPPRAPAEPEVVHHRRDVEPAHPLEAHAPPDHEHGAPQGHLHVAPDGHQQGTADPHGHQHGMPHRFEGADKWAKVFDAPERDAWQQPEVVVKRVAVRDDLTVVDLGAGTGYFSLRFAQALPKGRVIAADLEPTLLAHLSERADKGALANVSTRQVSPEGAGLEDLAGAVDVFFLCNTYHHISDRAAYFAKVAPLLRPGGRLVIVDFKLDSPRGPPSDHKLAAEAVIAELAPAGFELVARSDELPDQYVLELRARPTAAE